MSTSLFVSSLSRKTFQRAINENLEVTSAPKEKSKSPKDLCFTEEATELSIV